jgi:hypothetical protein
MAQLLLVAEYSGARTWWTTGGQQAAVTVGALSRLQSPQRAAPRVPRYDGRPSHAGCRGPSLSFGGTGRLLQGNPGGLTYWTLTSASRMPNP